MLAVLLYRELSWKEGFKVFVESGKATSVVALLIAAALIFNYIVASERLPEQVARLLDRARTCLRSCSCCSSICSS